MSSHTQKAHTSADVRENQNKQPIQLQHRDASRNLCWCAFSSNLTFIFEEQRGAVFNHFIVLALEQLALAVVEEQWCDHVVQFHPGFISWMLLQRDRKSSQGKESDTKVSEHKLSEPTDLHL